MMWFSESGIVRHTLDVPLGDSEGLFVFARPSEVVLLGHPIAYDPDSIRHYLITRTYTHDGVPLSVDTLFRESLANNSFVAQTAFAMHDDELFIGILTGRDTPTPRRYLRTVQHWPDTTKVNGSVYCDFLNHTYVNALALSPGPVAGPDEYIAAAFGAFLSDTTTIHITVLTGDSLLPDRHIQSLRIGQSLTGLSALWSGETIYAAYTANNITTPASGGAYVFAFPSSDIYSAVAERPEPPRVFHLAVYPNPFNSTARIAFSLDRSADVTLQVFDVTGRTVDEIVLGRQNIGVHETMWNARNRPSGIYFARLQTGRASAVAKLLLVR